MVEPNGRSVDELLAILRVVACQDIHLSWVQQRRSHEGLQLGTEDETHSRVIAFSMYACTALNEHEARLLQAGGSPRLEGTMPQRSAPGLANLWREVDRMARGIYGDGCGVLSSRDEAGTWRASVSTLVDRRTRALSDAALTTHFEAVGEEERDVLLAVAAFVGAGRRARPARS